MPETSLYVLMLSVHGLIRGQQLELGRDSDTGGQTKYVVELLRALGECEQVAQVDLVTRRIEDSKIDPDYAQREERVTEKSRIIRFDCGEPGYLPKEALWDSLDNFVDHVLTWLRAQPILPHVIHSHYADAGYVGMRLANQLGIPLVHTGHSLGRSKLQRLLATGLDNQTIEQQYNMSRRIVAEEDVLGVADRIITSTAQEIDEQYGLYDHYQPERMEVIPPGTDLSIFFPPDGEENHSVAAKSLYRFLREPEKPMILAVARPDPRKNLIALVEAYGESCRLQKLANLVIVAGNRHDISEMDERTQQVIQELLYTIDHYDLYGKVAYPKQHAADDVPLFYRLAALHGGVFVNPALTEPFGLTLIEAAASGLPIVATEDGGPIDIISNCHNGVLIDPLQRESITQGLLTVLEDADQWQQMAQSGIKGVRQYYSWQAHAKHYLRELTTICGSKADHIPKTIPRPRQRFFYRDKALVSDLDQSLLGDLEAIQRLADLIRRQRQKMLFAIATGRRLDSALRLIRHHKIPMPSVLISSLGTAIHYTPDLTPDEQWQEHIDYLWKPNRTRRLLDQVSGLQRQPRSEQSSYKLSYLIDQSQAPNLNELSQQLHQQDISVNLTVSFGQYLDVTPIRASKGQALRWFASSRHMELSNILVAGGSGADEDMIRGNTLAVVVANRHHEELSALTAHSQVYYAKGNHADGILEAIEHFEFLPHD